MDSRFYFLKEKKNEDNLISSGSKVLNFKYYEQDLPFDVYDLCLELSKNNKVLEKIEKSVSLDESNDLNQFFVSDDSFKEESTLFDDSNLKDRNFLKLNNLIYYKKIDSKINMNDNKSLSFDLINNFEEKDKKNFLGENFSLEENKNNLENVKLENLIENQSFLGVFPKVSYGLENKVSNFTNYGQLNSLSQYLNSSRKPYYRKVCKSYRPY